MVFKYSKQLYKFTYLPIQKNRRKGYLKGLLEKKKK